MFYNNSPTSVSLIKQNLIKTPIFIVEGLAPAATLTELKYEKEISSCTSS